MSYSLDTSELIEAWNGPYRPSVVHTLWQAHLPALIAASRIVISRSVYEELRTGGDDLFEWVRDTASAAIAEDDIPIQEIVREIQTNWPNDQIDFLRQLTGADLFVIAHAQANGSAVLTDENFSGNLLHPRIPDACRHLGVKCGRIVDMLESEGLSL